MQRKCEELQLTADGSTFPSRSCPNQHSPLVPRLGSVSAPALPTSRAADTRRSPLIRRRLAGVVGTLSGAARQRSDRVRQRRPVRAAAPAALGGLGAARAVRAATGRRPLLLPSQHHPAADTLHPPGCGRWVEGGWDTLRVLFLFHFTSIQLHPLKSVILWVSSCSGEPDQ